MPYLPNSPFVQDPRINGRYQEYYEQQGMPQHLIQEALGGQPTAIPHEQIQSRIDEIQQELSLMDQQAQAQPQASMPGFGQTDFMQNPMLQAIQSDVTNRVFANQAARGKLGSGETLEALQSRMAPIALGFRQNEIGNLMNLFQMGANVGIGQGSQGISGAQGAGNALMQGGMAQGQGILGSGQAQMQGLQDAAGFGGMLYNQYRPTASASPQFRTYELSGGAGTRPVVQGGYAQGPLQAGGTF